MNDFEKLDKTNKKLVKWSIVALIVGVIAVGASIVPVVKAFVFALTSVSLLLFLFVSTFLIPCVILIIAFWIVSRTMSRCCDDDSCKKC